jgi:glutamate--glyoxylate aminotransferase
MMMKWGPDDDLLHQVAALCAAPFLLERPDVDQIFPKDAIARAKKILAAFKGGVGAYTDSRGNPLVREEVANFFTKRDGVTSNPDVSTRFKLVRISESSI